MAPKRRNRCRAPTEDRSATERISEDLIRQQNKVLVQIMDKRKKRHRFLLESTPKQLIQITDEYIYSDFGQIVPLI